MLCVFERSGIVGGWCWEEEKVEYPGGRGALYTHSTPLQFDLGCGKGRPRKGINDTLLNRSRPETIYGKNADQSKSVVEKLEKSRARYLRELK